MPNNTTSTTATVIEKSRDQLRMAHLEELEFSNKMSMINTGGGFSQSIIGAPTSSYESKKPKE